MKLSEEHGAVLTGRASAAQIVEEVVEELSGQNSVVIDFAGVKAVSPSFADELFGKLTTRLNGRVVEFVNLSEHLTAVAAMAAAQRRLSDDNR